MQKAIFSSILLACTATLGFAGQADAAETKTLYASATGLYAKFYYVVEEAAAKTKAECLAMSGEPANYFTIEDVAKDADRVTITVSQGCTL